MEQDALVPEVTNFVKWAKKQLGIQGSVVVRLRRNRMKHGTQSTFGGFDPTSGKITVSVEGRHLLDICRTIAHEMTHQKQSESHSFSSQDGETGSDIENQANAVAGILMRNWGKSF
jgi:hypothetical protein